MSYDNTCKYLAERDPASFVRWLLNAESENVEVLKTELSSEPIEADALVLVRVANRLLHLEFQTLPYSNPPMPMRMLEYKGRLLRQYNCSIEQVVIFLKSTTSELVFENWYEDESTTHSYRVIRLWEQDPTVPIANPGLLPLATLAQSNDPNALLVQISQRVATIEDTGRRDEISACISILAGLRFEKVLVNRLFREDIMRESVIYQDILQKGLEQGLQQGRLEGLQLGLQQGRLEGRQEGRKEAELAMLRRLLTRRLGVLEPQFDERIEKLSVSQLEDLGEALLDFSSVADLAAWLQAHEQQ